MMALKTKDPNQTQPLGPDLKDTTVWKMPAVELKALVDHVEKSSVSHPDLSPEATARFRDLVRLVSAQAKITSVQEQEDAKILKFVFPLIFSPNASIRRGALTFTNAFSRRPSGFNVSEFARELSPKGAFYEWMMSQILNDRNVDALRSWQTVIRHLGHFIHNSHGTGVLNSWLTIAEKAFKSDDMMVRKETFHSWEVLINNFAQSELTLNNSKRVKLVTRPLIAQSNMTKEPLMRAKFDAFWHFITKLGVNLHIKHHATVVVPFLELCYGRATSGEAKNDTSHPLPISPVKRFRSLQSRTLEAFAQLFGCPVVLNHTKRLELNDTGIETRNFVKNHVSLMNCLKEAHTCIILDEGKGEDVANFKLLFQAFAQLVHSVENTSDKNEMATISYFFNMSLYLLIESMGHAHTLSIGVQILEEVKRFPASVLNSRSLWKPKLESPGLAFVKAVLTHGLHQASVLGSESGEVREALLQCVQGLLKKGCVVKNESLKFLQAACVALATNAEAEDAASSEIVASVWVVLANGLREHIDKHTDINQAESPIVHCIDGALEVMAFPLKHLASKSGLRFSFLKQWSELYPAVMNTAALIVSYYPPEIEARLCEAIGLASPSEGRSDQELWIMAKIVCCQILPGISFKTLNDHQHELDVGRLQIILDVLVGLIGDLTSQRPRPVGGSSADSSEAGVVILKAIACLASNLTAPRFVELLIKSVIPNSIMLFAQDLSKRLGPEFEDGLERAFEAIANLLRHKSPTGGVSLLTPLEGFMITSMSHNKRLIRDQAQALWQATFAPVVSEAQIPAEIASILKRSSRQLSSSSLEPAQDDVVLDGMKPAQTSFKGSFFAHTPTKGELKQVGSKSGSPSPGRAFKRPIAKAAPKSLEDESSQDFVKITPSKRSKKRVLTPHQKAVMIKRHDDIPALYSELSRDDSVPTFIPSQFGSQDDTSSQAALDGTAFEAKVATSPAPSQPEDDGESVHSSSETSSAGSDHSLSTRRRKGKTPVKNLPFISKRVNSPARPRPGPKSKTRPPAQETSTIAATTDESQADESESSCSDTPGRSRRRRSQSRLSLSNVVNNGAQVVLEQLAPKLKRMVKLSPVKVITEEPLVVEPLVRRAAKELKFDHMDEDIIESSQIPAVPVKRTRGRPKRSASTSLDNPPPAKMKRTSRTPDSAGGKINKYGETPLHVAVKRSDLERVKSLLEQGADVHKPDHAGWTPIHEAIRDRPNAIAIIKLLLEHGADINAQAQDGNTPLHDAASYLSPTMIRCLLESGASVDVKNKDGNTPIDLAPLAHVKLLQAHVAQRSSPRKEILPPAPAEVSPHKIVVPSILELPSAADEPVIEDDKENATQSSEEPVQEDGDLGDDTTLIPESMDLSESAVLNERPPSCSNIRPPPMPNFTRLQDKANARRGGSRPFPSTGRGARLLEMSKAKQSEGSTSTTGPAMATPPLMSPKVGGQDVRKGRPPPTEADLMVTPTGRNKEAWEKYAPSPSNASPTASILKKKQALESTLSSLKRRRVQFTDPPVSERVEIPRLSALGKSVRQRLAATKFNIGGGRAESNGPALRTGGDLVDESCSLDYQATPPIDLESTEMIYPSLRDNDEPVTTILGHLASTIWQKAAEKSMAEAGITQIRHLASLLPKDTLSIKGLAPPDNLSTIKAALRRHETTILRKYRPSSAESRRLASPSLVKLKKIAPVVDISTPEEDEQCIQELFERPSPPPTEEVETPRVVTIDDDDEVEECPQQPEDMPTILNSYQKQQADKTTGTLEPESTDIGLQIMPEPIPSYSRAIMTDPIPTEAAQTQVELDCRDSSAQTEARSQAQIWDETLANLRGFDIAQLSKILSLSSELIAAKVAS